MGDKNYLKDKLLAAGFTLSEQQYDQLMLYYELLIEKNKVMNLTAITEFEEVINKHFVDSLALAKVFGGQKNAEEALSGKKLIDLGTGAGFPGVPLKIVFPKLHVTLLDSLNKRISFLNEVIEALSLEGIEGYHGRAEDYGRQKEFREQFDYCVSRAVANLSTLVEYCMPFVRVGGAFIPYKSGNITDELNQADKAIKVLGGQLREVKSFTLSETDIERSLVVIDKKASTKKAYPRKAGKPSKEPIQ